MMKLKQWLLNSKKAIIGALSPLLTVWALQLVQHYELPLPGELVAGGVTVILMVVFGAAVYLAENVPPELQDAIIDAVKEE
jgi:hypothetical protein